MDRDFAEIRSEVLSLDRESQRALADEIEAHLADSPSADSVAFLEAKRRVEAVERGEMKTVDGPEALARVRKLVQH